MDKTTDLRIDKRWTGPGGGAAIAGWFGFCV